MPDNPRIGLSYDAAAAEALRIVAHAMATQLDSKILLNHLNVTGVPAGIFTGPPPRITSTRIESRATSRRVTVTPADPTQAPLEPHMPRVNVEPHEPGPDLPDPATQTSGSDPAATPDEPAAAPRPICPACENAADDGLCSNCDECINGCCGCGCWVCDNCSRRRNQDYICPSCDRCCGSGCNACGCSDDDDEEEEEPEPEVRRTPTGVMFVRRQEPTFHKDGKKCDRVPLTRLASLEVEVANTARAAGGVIDPVVARWGMAVVHDGSLPSTGFEVCTAPAGGTKLEEQLGDLAAALLTAQARVSPECGLHCHADARDLTGFDLVKLVRLYAGLEMGLYSTVNEDRFTGRFCAPCGESMIPWLNETDPGDKNALLRYFANLGPKKKETATLQRRDNQVMRRVKEDAKQDKYAVRRYWGLNVGAYWTLGTIECRLHHGTTDPTELVDWATLWAAIVDRARTITHAELKALPGPERGYATSRFEAKSFERLLLVAPTNDVKRRLVERRRWQVCLPNNPGPTTRRRVLAETWAV